MNIFIRSRYYAAVAAVFLAALVSALAVSGQNVASNTLELSPGRAIEQSVRGGESVNFRFSLESGQFTRVFVDHKLVDISVSLIDGDSVIVTEMNGKDGLLWQESLTAIGTEQSSNFTVQIHAFGGSEQAGQYVIKLDSPKPTDVVARERFNAEQAFYTARKLATRKTPDNDAAIGSYLSAVNGWKTLGEKEWQAIGLFHLGWAYVQVSKLELALSAMQEAATIFKETKDRIGEGKAINGSAYVNVSLRNHEKAIGLFETAIAIRREVNDKRGEGNSLLGLVQALIQLKQFERSLEILGQVLAIRREIGSKSEQVETLRNIAYVYSLLKQNQRSIEFNDSALLIQRTLDDNAGSSDILNDIGVAYYGLGQYEKAIEYFTETIKLRTALNDRLGIGLALASIGGAERNLKRFEKSKIHYEQALVIARELKDRARESKLLGDLAYLYDIWGQPETASELYSQQLSIKRELKDLQGALQVLISLGNLTHRSGDYAKSALYLENALSIGVETDDKVGQSKSLDMLGVVYSRLNQYDRAESVYKQALQMRRDLPNREGEAETLHHLALLYHNVKKFDQAEDFYRQTISLKKELSDKRGIAKVLNDLGITYFIAKRAAKAVETFDSALAVLRDLNDKNLEIEVLRNKGATLYLELAEFDESNECFLKAIAIAKEIKDRDKESQMLEFLADLHQGEGRSQTAETLYKQAVEINREARDQLGLLRSLTYLGSFYGVTRQYEKSKAIYRESLALARELKNRKEEVNILFAQGDAALFNQSRFADAKSDLELALSISKELPGLELRSTALARLGSLYQILGQIDKAKEYFDQSFTIAVESKNRESECGAIALLGRFHYRLNQFERSRDNFERAISFCKEASSKKAYGLLIKDLADVYQRLGNLKKAGELYKESLKVAEETKYIALEGGVNIGLARMYARTDQLEDAKRSYKLALNTFSKSSRFESSSTDAEFMVFLGDQLRQHDLAIVYGKKAINVFQEMRNDIRDLDKKERDSFLGESIYYYRYLSNLLVEAGRLPEAQAVLDLLKDEEFDQLSRGETPGIVPYSQAEESSLAIIDSLVSLENEQSQLKHLQKEQRDEFPAEKAARLDQIAGSIKLANEELEKTLVAIAKSDSSVESQIKNIQSEKNLQSALQSLGKEMNTGVVALYTVIAGGNGNGGVETEDSSRFGWVILVTSRERKAYPIDVKNLEKNVFQFRNSLVNDKYDPRPASQKIYNAIFRQTSDKQKVTLEDDLAKLFVGKSDKTLMWSLDGVLRYIPMAALYDGNNYLVDKYKNVVFTKESLLWLMDQPTKNGQTLGLGVSLGNKELNMSTLPGVDRELVDIVRETNEKTGILSGTRKLNSAFKKQAILSLGDEDNQFRTVHIASHFSFNPADQNSSYLLIGDGKLTFADMRAESNLFGTVDLLTLSACDTAMSANGKESEGFAYLAQSLGAKSVLATLWKVSDAGTPELMIRFYRLLAADPGMSKSEAFRRAQLSLLNGDKSDWQQTSNIDTGKRSEPLVVDMGQHALVPYQKDPTKPFGHPHYWAPFVLIGNWR